MSRPVLRNDYRDTCPRTPEEIAEKEAEEAAFAAQLDAEFTAGPPILGSILANRLKETAEERQARATLRRLEKARAFRATTERAIPG